MQYQEKYQTFQHVKNLTKSWKALKRASSKNTHKRLEAVVKADGGYIEKK